MLRTRIHQIFKSDQTNSLKGKGGSLPVTVPNIFTLRANTRIFKSFSCSETPTTNFPELVKQLTENGLLDTDTSGAMYETSTKQY
jgi:hypothetical protein